MPDYGYNPGDIGFRSPGEPVRMPIMMPPAGAPPRQLSPAQPVQPPYMMPPPSGAPLRWPPPAQAPVTMPWLSPRTAFPRLSQFPRYTGTSPKPPRFSIGSEAILALLNSL